MSNLSWSIGEARVTRIEESLSPIPGNMLLPEATPESLAVYSEWLRPHFVDAEGNLLLSIHGLVIESCGQKILVDTCVGDRQIPGMEMLSAEENSFLADMAQAGFPRQSIDVVLCTHLHFDHVGWNTMPEGDRWVPTFPNARYLFARVEHAHWREADEIYGASQEAMQPLFDAGLVDLVETEHRITDEVWLEPTPGHTPGHVAVRIASADRQAFITGDLVHHPVQWAEPGWKDLADFDSAAAEATRRRIVKEHADTPLLVIGTHFAPPCAGRLVTVEARCRFET